MKAAIYTRVSTDNQAEVEFNSCEAQEAKIMSFIKSQDNLEAHRTYSDQGYTGANLERPELQKMLYDIQQGLINTVISYKIDRLTRSPKDFYHLIEVFDKYGVSFFSVTERFDTSTPSGRLLRNIMLTFAQFERELISERIKDKMLEKAKKGMWNSGHTPYGYKRENKKLVIDPTEAKIVRTVFETFVQTGSKCAVYHKLMDQGVLDRHNKVFSKSTIDCTLQKVLYTGKLLFRGKIYDAIHDPIISPELFEEAQGLKKDLPRKMTSYNYSLFPGLITCKECGSAMSPVFSNKISSGKRVRYFYYKCVGACKRDRSFCSTRQVSSDRLDEFIIDNLDNIAKNKQYLDSLIFTLNNSPKPIPSGLELKGSSSDEIPINTERVREILQNIVDASKIKGKIEKRVIVKRHIGKVIYSKETIEVKVLYSESGDAASGPSRHRDDPSAEISDVNKDQAAFRHCAPSSRLTSTMVRYGKEMGPGGLEPPTSRLSVACSSQLSYEPIRFA